MKKLISIVTPAYNEEEVIGELANRLCQIKKSLNKYDFEIVVVENGSSDLTLQKLMQIRSVDPTFKIIQLSRNFGYEGGITAGLMNAKGDAVIMMNADLQDPPEMIPKFIKKWEEGYDIVYAVIQKREGISVIRSFTYSNFYRVINLLTKNIIPRNVTEFRLMDKKVYSVINCMNERNRFIRGMVAWTGFKQIGIPFIRPPRFAGKSKGGDFNTIMTTATNGIISFSYLPLKLSMIIGFLVSVSSFAAILYILVLYLIYGSIIPGYFSTLIVILFFFGVLFIIIGIMGLYISKIYDEVKKRPMYIIKNKFGFDLK